MVEIYFEQSLRRGEPQFGLALPAELVFKFSFASSRLRYGEFAQAVSTFGHHGPPNPDASEFCNLSETPVVSNQKHGVLDILPAH